LRNRSTQLQKTDLPFLFERPECIVYGIVDAENFVEPSDFENFHGRRQPRATYIAKLHGRICDFAFLIQQHEFANHGGTHKRNAL